jgi:hypothetical protein
MPERRRTPAGGVQAEKQQRYVRLIAQGISNSEACRLVGIKRRTGTRWRYGRTVLYRRGGRALFGGEDLGAQAAQPAILSQPERIAIP